MTPSINSHLTNICSVNSRTFPSGDGVAMVNNPSGRPSEVLTGSASAAGANTHAADQPAGLPGQVTDPAGALGALGAQGGLFLTPGRRTAGQRTAHTTVGMCGAFKRPRLRPNWRKGHWQQQQRGMRGRDESVKPVDRCTHAQRLTEPGVREPRTRVASGMWSPGESQHSDRATVT